MAKDPAFLFYDGDAAKDVSHMNRLERGGYFDLIQAQRKFGRMDLSMIKKILGQDFEATWESIKMVMTYVEHKFYISWLEESTEARKNYCLSRKKNRSGGKISKLGKRDMSYICETHVEHMENENENENKDKNTTKIVPEFRECSELLQTRILQRRQAKINEKTLLQWDRDVRLMIERDKRTLEEIKNLINECHDMEPNARGFTWRDNILSMGKLRSQWNEGKIYVGMGKANKIKSDREKAIDREEDAQYAKNKRLQAEGKL